MPEFESWRSYMRFASSVKRKARYIYDRAVEDFLATVLATGDSRKRELPNDKYLWRAQHGHDWSTVEVEELDIDVPAVHRPERMKPLADSAREGRVNPKGIPCLYLSTDRDTAMAEVRPWLGSYVSVGQFKTLRNLKLIDCSVSHGTSGTFYRKEPDAAEREKAVWGDIDRAFSSPVTEDESTADYAPTQVLAEAFRQHGYDGIVYKSLLGAGLNVALFELDTAELVNCFLYETKSINFAFEEVAIIRPS